MNVPELLLPAGSPGKLKVAYQYGGDAAYAGAAGFSMRPDEASFSIDDIRYGSEIARSMGKRFYVGVNSMLFEDDLAELDEWLAATDDVAMDAIIVADCGAMELIKKRRPDVKIHISTQMAVANATAVNFWASAGAGRVVLARECTLKQTAKITGNAKTEVEIFVHGAMCVAVSGRCLLSAHLAGKSGSRGECKHVCRWNWQLVESKRPGLTVPVFETGKETVFLGSKDLCLLEYLPQVVASGVSSLKVEGRMKGEYYVAVVANVYRQALDALATEGENWRCRQEWIDELDSVTHQPYSTGFAFGYPENNPGELQAGERVAGSKDIVAIVLENMGDGFFSLESKRPFSPGEEIEFISPAGNGVVTIGEIFTEQGHYQQRTHVGPRYKVKLSQPLPNYAILRKNAT